MFALSIVYITLNGSMNSFLLQEKSIRVDGLNVHYKIAGHTKDAPLLILHGWGSSSSRWARVAELLARGNSLQVIVPDLPGFGESDAPHSVWDMREYALFVERFAQALHLKTFYLLGHSFGGGLALLYASEHPENVRKVFLVAAAIRRRKTAYKRIMSMIAACSKPFSFLPFYALFRKGFYKYVVRKSDYSYQKGIRKSIFRKVVAQDLTYLLPTLRVPAVVIWGAQDGVTPLRDGHFIHEAVINSRLFVIPEGNHDLERTAPEVLAGYIKEAL